MKSLIDLLLSLFGKKKADLAALPPGSEAQEPEEPAVRLPGDDDIDAAEDHEEYRGLLEKEPDEKSPEEWGLDQVELVLKVGDRGNQVREFQQWLIDLDFDLPRFGADGSLGNETLSATREFQDAHDLTAREDSLKVRGVGQETYEAVRAMVSKLPPAPPPSPPPLVPGLPYVKLENDIKLYDITGQHAGKRRVRKRKWADISGITLHQTATNFGNNPLRYANIAAQMGVTPDGKVVLMNTLDWVVFHGHAFNSRDVGIEIDGHFAGVEGNLATYWRPASQPNRQPMSVSDIQVAATLAAIQWIIDTVAAHGGKIKYIHAHRQSSTMRASDPGSKVWERIALEAKKRWGLIDGGPTFKIGGYTIPKEWDPSYTDRYRQW